MTPSDQENKNASVAFAGGSAHGGDIWGAARRLKRPLNEILDLSASLNPLGPPPGLAEEMAGCLGLLCHYPDRHTVELNQALAEACGLEPGNVLPGNGSTALIRLVARALDLKTILLLAPTFGDFARALALAGRHFHHFFLKEENNFAPTMADVEDLWQQEPSCLILGNPLSPSGGLVDSSVLEAILAQAERRRAWVVLDEAFIDFAPAPAQGWAPAKVLANPRFIVLRSLTKFYCLAGLRLGYLLAHQDTAAELRLLGEPWSVNTLAQKAGPYCLAQKQYAEKTREVVSLWRKAQAERLAELGLFVFPSQANYLLVRLPAEGPTAAQVAKACAQQGVLLRDCASFNGCAPYHLRIAVASLEEQERLFSVLTPALKA